MTKQNTALILAYNKGYRVHDGEVVSPLGNVLLTRLKGGYYRFSIRIGEVVHVAVHRLVAYQKYGLEMFKEGIEVRHLDGDSTNNLSENIAIGTHSENMMDMPKEVRVKKAINASNKIRRFSDEHVAEIKAFYAETKSYKATMDKFGISSKGTLHYMLNKDYCTTK